MFPFPIIPPFVSSAAETIKRMAVASNNTMLLSSKGNLYVTGQNRIGELGVGDTTNRYNQWVLVMQNVNHIAAVRETLYAVKTDGTVLTPKLTSGTGQYSWQPITSWSSAGDLSGDNIRKIVSDTENVFVLKKDNSLYYLGTNSGGQGNTGDTSTVGVMRSHTTDVQQLSVSGNIVVILKSNGFLYGCGQDTRNVISAGSSPRTLTQMFGANADGGTISDFVVTGSGQALLVRYSNGKYRTKGLNIGQLPTGTASPGNTLTDVPDGFTPGNGTEPLFRNVGIPLAGGTYPTYAYDLFYYTGGKFYACGSATGQITGVNQSSGTVAPWTQMDGTSVQIVNPKGMSFGEGWAIAYNDTQIMYWGSNGSTTVKPIAGYVSDGRPVYQARLATSPLAA